MGRENVHRHPAKLVQSLELVCGRDSYQGLALGQRIRGTHRLWCSRLSMRLRTSTFRTMKKSNFRRPLTPLTQKQYQALCSRGRPQISFRGACRRDEREFHKAGHRSRRYNMPHRFRSTGGRQCEK